jgi:hypothetical protein
MVRLFKLLTLLVFCTVLTNSCKSKNMSQNCNVLFLHHSTGKCIWRGNYNRLLNKFIKTSAVERYFNRYNRKHNTEYKIVEQVFPKKKPYGWKNYPFDYYNIWITHGDSSYYMEEPTLDVLTSEYNVIILKHCFPVGDIEDDTIATGNDPETKTLENYKMQYLALRDKFKSYPDTKFILWTPPALNKSQTTEAKALRLKAFAEWVVNEWDQPGDNIYLWDFYQLETEGGLYLNEKYATASNDAHPNPGFSGKMAVLFSNRIVSVIEGKGDQNPLSGKE